MLAHFAYGALAGAVYARTLGRPTSSGGAIYGLLVWIASYLGWIPASGLLKPATGHPPRRNALMIAAHLVWGTVLAFSINEIERAETGPFRGDNVRDAKD